MVCWAWLTQSRLWGPHLQHGAVHKQAQREGPGLQAGRRQGHEAALRCGVAVHAGVGAVHINASLHETGTQHSYSARPGCTIKQGATKNLLTVSQARNT